MTRQRSICNRWLVYVSLAGLLLGCNIAAAASYDVYLLAGQSNMDGRGQASDLPAEQRQPFEHAIIFYRNLPHTSEGWKPLGPGYSIPPKYEGTLPSQTFGPELGFARAMLDGQPLKKLALIKGSKGGTSLRTDWNPGSQGDPDSQGPRYRDFIETIRLATNQLTQRGETYTLRGLLWHQGESDSKSSVKDYQQRLDQLIIRIREDLGVADLPVIVGEVFDNRKRDNVRAAIRAVGTSGPRVGFVSSDDTTTWDEGTHFDAPSQLLLGQRYAEAICNVQTRDARSRPKVVCFGDSITKRGYPKILSGLVDVDSINAGVAGNTTSQALRRVQSDVLDHSPEVVVILFGTNDMRIDSERAFVPVDKYKDNLTAIINDCRGAGSKVVLCTLPPIDPGPYFTRHDRNAFEQSGGLPALVARYQAAAADVAKKCDVPLVDLQSLLTNDPEWLSNDGVHPSNAGNAIIAAHIAKAVSVLCREATTP
ncbi:sialate O-acetylesterase [Novipirellula artificiosorum]|uniref:sialate O-acetylesterase n=1 Tax=Novipirellula artificiosorum TaxID=2528016 RepID=UPI0011B731C6|nr:sialate O-acetylesterase [Novipirellula artificiosorum]